MLGMRDRRCGHGNWVRAPAVERGLDSGIDDGDAFPSRNAANPGGSSRGASPEASPLDGIEQAWEGSVRGRGGCTIRGPFGAIHSATILNYREVQQIEETNAQQPRMDPSPDITWTDGSVIYVM